VIAIDEIDKIEALDDVRTLLRDVKAVLDPIGAVLLVAISDEAVTHLGLSGLRGRDEISSSFATMLRVPPLTADQCEALVAARLGFSLPRVARVLDVVSAGNPREIVRLLESYERRCLASGTGAIVDDAKLCLSTSLEIEAEDFLTGVVAQPDVGDAVRLNAYRWVKTQVAGADRLGDLAMSELVAAWDPPWQGSAAAWPPDLAEHWRRFLLRTAVHRIVWERVGNEPDAKLDTTWVDQVRRVVAMASASAGIARLIAEEELCLLHGWLGVQGSNLRQRAPRAGSERPGA
jgi:hypothetical protein